MATTAGKKMKNYTCGPKNFPLRGGKFIHNDIFMGGGGIQILVRINSPFLSVYQLTNRDAIVLNPKSRCIVPRSYAEEGLFG